MRYDQTMKNGSMTTKKRHKKNRNQRVKGRIRRGELIAGDFQQPKQVISTEDRSLRSILCAET